MANITTTIEIIQKIWIAKRTIFMIEKKGSLCDELMLKYWEDLVPGYPLRLWGLNLRNSMVIYMVI